MDHIEDAESAVVPLVLELGLETLASRSGGLNRYFENLVHTLDRIGAPVRAIVFGEGGGHPGPPTAVVPAGRSALRRFLAFRAAVRVEIASAELVDAHFALTGLSLFPRQLGHRPLVVHFHGPWADESAAMGESKVACYLKRAIERFVYRRAAAFVVLSRSHRRLLLKGFGASPWDIEVIGPGIDTAHFSPGDRDAARAALGLAPDSFVVLSVRRLVPRMGLQVMAEAWQRIAMDSERDAHWLVVGDGPERSSLEAETARLGIGGTVRFMGFVGEEELVSCYRAADVTVVPSLELEGFGLVTLESLACGVPVVASDVGGLREAVGPLSPELLVPPCDADALAERLSEVRDGTVRVPGPGECRSFSERSSWEAVADHHVALFRRVVDRCRTTDLRVVVVGHSAQLSGGELAIMRLVEAMPEVKVHAILAEDGPLVALLEDAGASVEVLPLDTRARDLRRDHASPGRIPLRTALTTVVYTVRLALRLRRLHPDLVHTNTLKAALYGGVAARLGGRPCLWHIRDRIADDYLPPASVKIIRWLSRIVPTEIVVNSRSTGAALTLGRRGRTSRPIITVVPSPVRTGGGAARPTANGSGMRFVMLGRLSPWKGQDVFLRAFAKAFGGGAHKAIVAGAPFFGEEDYLQKLVDLVKSLGIGGQVEFRGFVGDVPQLLGEADVLVHASLLPEPFGQVVVEGMAAGLAVVASDQGGPAETVTDEFDGILVGPGDVAALAATLKRLAEDPALRQRLGENGRATALRYAPDVIGEQMLTIYERMCGRGGGPAMVKRRGSEVAS